MDWGFFKGVDRWGNFIGFRSAISVFFWLYFVNWLRKICVLGNFLRQKVLSKNLRIQMRLVFSFTFMKGQNEENYLK